jgi:hypothetical protein
MARPQPNVSNEVPNFWQRLDPLPESVTNTRAKAGGVRLAARTRVLLGLGTTPLGGIEDLASDTSAPMSMADTSHRRSVGWYAR